jgi:lipopolysaccharide cholinephosphotransferase
MYSLCGGSVIGACLYNGFIPWDDDIDIMMTRDNYTRFMEIFPKHAPHNYRLLNYKLQKEVKVPTLFSRVEDMNTEVEEEIAHVKRIGHVFVDITVMDNVGSKLMHKMAYGYGSYVYSYLYKWNNMTPGTRWKHVLFNTAMLKLDEEKTMALYKRYEAYCSKLSNIKTPYCAELMSAACSSYIYDRSLFDEYMDIEFAGMKLMIVKNYPDYLYSRYHRREFAREVPKEQRYHSHIVAFRESH